MLIDDDSGDISLEDLRSPIIGSFVEGFEDSLTEEKVMKEYER